MRPSMTLLFAAAWLGAGCGSSTGDTHGARVDDEMVAAGRGTDRGEDPSGTDGELEPSSPGAEAEVGIAEGRATDEDGFLAQALDILRRGDADAWNARQMTREEYETRCAELVRNNPAGWLDEHMARREEPLNHATTRCERLRSSEPLRVLDRRGGGPTQRIRMPECVDYRPLDPFRLIVESASGDRFSVRVDAYVDERDGTYLPSGYAECHSALPAGYACARLLDLTEGSGSSLSRHTCQQALAPYEGGEVDETAIHCIEEATTATDAQACWAARMRGGE